MKKYFAVIDAGSVNITTLLARWGRDNKYQIEGFYTGKSKGLKRGVITDPALATDSIRNALKELKKKTKRNFHDVYVRISSTSINIIPSSGMVLLSKYGKEVTETDVKKAVTIASTLKLPLDEELLHKVVQDFSIDKDTGINNPVDLEGVKLGVNLNILTVNSSTLKNFGKCVAQAGFVPVGFIFSGIASSYRCLNKQDMDLGVALLDICRDITEVMVFDGGVLTDCRVFSAGSDIFVGEGGVIDQRSVSELITQVVSLRGWRNVKKIVVIGEGALLEGLIESLENILSFPVMAGSARPLHLDNIPVNTSQYMGALGVLDYLQEERNKIYSNTTLLKRGVKTIVSFLDKYF